MAVTVLQYTNLVLTRAGVISSDLSALTSNSQQQDVDNMLSAINEVVDELIFIAGMPTPAAVKTGTITLATNDRSYAVASDFVSLADPIFKDETNEQYLYPYPGGFTKMRADQPDPTSFTGLPLYYAIDPETGEIYLDTLPTSNENGRQYKYLYNEETNFVTSAPSGTFPFTDELMRQAIPAVIQTFNRDRRREMYSEKARDKALAMAARLLPQTPAGTRYGPHARQR